MSTHYRIKESSGWQQVFSSPYLDWTIERIALNAKVVGGPHGDKDKMVAAASESSIILWSIQDGGSGNEIGGFTGVKGIPSILIHISSSSNLNSHPPALDFYQYCLWIPAILCLRRIQPRRTCWRPLLHREPVGCYKPHRKGWGVECRHTTLAGMTYDLPVRWR